MENASKALIMAAEVLIGVMIISIGTYLFNVFSDYSADTAIRIEKVQIDEFNNQFLKFYGSRINDEGKKETIKCTIHDIAGLANLANKNNVQFELENSTGYSSNSRYIQIDINGKKNIEKYSESKIIELIKENDLIISMDENGKRVANTKYYKCTNCDISPDTKRVNYMKFVEI